MGNYKSILLISCLLLLTAHCSTADKCSDGNDYTISYSSGGGFTGIVSGLMIYCSGTVKFWQKRLNSTPVVVDSVELDANQLKKFDDIVSNPEIFIYKNDYRGNYTSYLSVIAGDKSNGFSFNNSDLPGDMPASVKKLLEAINNIKH